MAYKLRGKIEVRREESQNPEQNGIRAQKIGLDFDIIAPDGHELVSEEVINGGFAWKGTIGFENEAHERVVLCIGNGITSVEARFPLGHPSEGKAVPAPGYTLQGAGVMALEHSNGLRLVANFKKLPQGYYTAFGSFEGVDGKAKFANGDTIRIGKAKPRP